MGELKQIYEMFKSEADFPRIYIHEAHAVDEWKQGNAVEVRQHKTLEERMAVAAKFVRDFDYPIPTVCVTMSNAANTCFGIWTERYILIDQSGRIAFVQPRQDDFYGYEGRHEAELTDSSG